MKHSTTSIGVQRAPQTRRLGGTVGLEVVTRALNKRVGQMVTPLGTEDCKGWENRWENEHFKFKKVGFSALNKF